MPEENYLNLNWKEGLTKLLPIGAVVLTAFYLIGFIIVGSYLDQFGLRSVGIFQIQYLAIGTVFLVIFAVNLLIYFGYLRAALTTKEERITERLQRLFNYFTTFIGVNTLFFILFLRIVPSALSGEKVTLPSLGFVAFLTLMGIHFKGVAEWVRRLILVFSFVILSAIFSIFSFLSVPFFFQGYFLWAFRVEDAKLLKEFDWLQKKLFWGFKSAVLVMVVLLCCYFFGHSLYGKVPGYLGGGKPVVLQLAIPDDDVVFLNRLGIDTEGKSLTPPLFLIYETNTEYYILTSTSSNNANAIGIPKKIVKGIILSR